MVSLSPRADILGGFNLVWQKVIQNNLTGKNTICYFCPTSKVFTWRGSHTWLGHFKPPKNVQKVFGQPTRLFHPISPAKMYKYFKKVGSFFAIGLLLVPIWMPLSVQRRLLFFFYLQTHTNVFFQFKISLQGSLRSSPKISTNKRLANRSCKSYHSVLKKPSTPSIAKYTNLKRIYLKKKIITTPKFFTVSWKRNY